MFMPHRRVISLLESGFYRPSLLLLLLYDGGGVIFFSFTSRKLIVSGLHGSHSSLGQHGVGIGQIVFAYSERV